jgi:UDP-glucose 4-epimerase
MSKTNILVTGGAGFIGSHMVQLLTANGYHVIVLDNLLHGHADSVISATLVKADLADTKTLDAIFAAHQFEAVLHFAALISVGESVANPALYYQNNTQNTLNLLDSMVKYNVKHFIFSSTAAIFGEPQYTPIDTQHPKQPINAYGRSKWLVEQTLSDYQHAYDLQSICLRYFNAAGADPSGQLGDRHIPQFHLIPLTLLAALGKRDNITVYGDDYPTTDGTCIRDYIHVSDLCQAHLLALHALQNGAKSTAYNLGNGMGFSVKQVIETAEQVTQKNIPVIFGERRTGDPAILIADSSSIKSELNWQPQYPELKTIVQHAWHSIKKFYA